MILRLIKAIASFTLLGFISLSTTAWASAPDYQQLPSHDGGFSSDPATIIVADDFQLTQEASLQSITWWGGYASSDYLPIPDTDNFLISLYADDSGKPGSLLQTINVGDSASRNSTGDFVNPPIYDYFYFPGRVEFQYSINLSSAIPLHAGTHYWLSIVNSPSSDSWVWEFSMNFPNPGVQRISASGVGGWEPYDSYNAAFSLGLTSPVPEPENYGMLLVGLGLLGFMVHRKKQNA